MRDSHIRAATKRTLFAQHKDDTETVIFEELGVQHGLSRIDLAVVNGELHGFELKSNKDTLKRLPEQVAAYGLIFDRVTLVLGEHHVAQAVEIIPDWWGLRIARFESGLMVFVDLRLAIKNPSIDPMSVVALLWRDEALKFLEESGSARAFRSECRADIYAALVERVDVDSIRDRVRACLRQRSNWRSGATRLSCGDLSRREARFQDCRGC
jgi:hypothetical protein